MRTLAALAACALVGCGPSLPPLPTPPPPALVASVAPPDPAPDARPQALPDPLQLQPKPRPPPTPPPPPPPPFPPPAFRAPGEHAARPGDGTWAAMVPDPVGGPALLYRTTVHPDRTKPQAVVTLVAVDLGRVAMRLVAGTLEPIAPAVPPGHRTGLIPAADWPDLLAVMNGGFMTRHGGWGMWIAGESFLPPHDDGCTVALYAETVQIRTYSQLAGSLGKVLAFRQTPPCLVEQGSVHPSLLGEDKPRRWGLSETGGVDIRRSAVGLADGGRTLFYGLGEAITPRALAEAMLAAGAVDAAELDVNWSYTRFLLYAGSTAAPQVTSTLIPEIKHAQGEYVSRPAERDFFYLARRR